MRIAPIAPKRVLGNIRPYLISLIIYRKPPPILNGRIDWMTIAQACGIEDDLMAELKRTSERRLEDMKCGELRWSDHDRGWEVLIPSVAFKNSGSSFFGQKPFRLILPDLLDLYKYLEAYIDKHRGVLLGIAKDSGTLFVKTVKTTSVDAAYDSTTFYEASRTVIQRYGICNPYTGRGAIKGLLPHGPHNLRDILATHILKQTGSHEQASYAIQDTPDVVQQHYGRFLPQDKAALAAKILNQVWEAA